MSVTQALLSFALVAALLTVVPGLDTALVLRSSITRSRRYALATALGTQTGTMVWGLAAAAGTSTLLAASRTAYKIISLLGAGYLVWMGSSLLIKSFRRTTPVAPAGATQPAGGAARGWLTGLQSARVARILDRVTGGVLIAFGAKLALGSRS